MKTKRFLALAASMAMVLSVFSGCTQAPQSPASPPPEAGGVPQSSAPAPGGTGKGVSFHYGLTDEPPGIDPSVSQGATQSTIYAALYEGLVTSDAEGNIVPGAAESWTTNEDKTQYTFKLRDGLKWSDGQPLTASDFVYAWLRVLTPETASTYSWYVEGFLKNGSAFAAGEVTAEEVGVQAVDERTLEVTLNMPASYFLQALLQGCWLPVRQDVVEANPEKWCFDAATCITNGPFQFTEYKVGSYITAVKNENYWDADSVQIENLKFSFIKDPATALSAFQAGDVDGIGGVPATDFINLLATDQQLHTYNRLSLNFLRLNTETKGLDDARVRRAISLAFDRKGYLEGQGNLTAQPALGAVPGGLILAGEDFREASGDNGLSSAPVLEQAKALLVEAGYPDGQGLPTLRLHCAQNSLKAAEIVQQMLLTNLGIQTEIKPVDDKLNFPMMVEGQYDIAFGGWGGDYTHPMTFLSLFTSVAYDNCTRWSNAQYDELIEQAGMEVDEAKALALMVQAEHILCEESPMVPLSFPAGAIMMRDTVTNWFISSSETLYISRANVA